MAILTKQIAYFGGNDPLFQTREVSGVGHSILLRDTISEDTNFVDPGLVFSSPLNKDLTYYLRFQIEPYDNFLSNSSEKDYPNRVEILNSETFYTNNDYYVQVVAYSHMATDNSGGIRVPDEQLIKTIKVAKNGDENKGKPIVVECIFQPYLANLDRLSLRIRREGADYQKMLTDCEKDNIRSQNGLGWDVNNTSEEIKSCEYGRFPRIKRSTVSIYEVQNVLADDTAAKQGRIKKIGIQGRPNLLFSINGEEMRLNKTGIYEISYDRIDVNHIGFIVKDPQNANIDSSIILDYTYVSSPSSGVLPISNEEG